MRGTGPPGTQKKRSRSRAQKLSPPQIIAALQGLQLHGSLGTDAVWLEVSLDAAAVLERCALGLGTSRQEPNYQHQAADEQAPSSVSLRLTLEEGFFLAYSLGSLSISAPSSETGAGRGEPQAAEHADTGGAAGGAGSVAAAGAGALSVEELWRACCARRRTWPLDYATFHHFRCKGWIPKPGLQYGATWTLYAAHPAHEHAKYLSRVVPLGAAAAAFATFAPPPLPAAADDASIAVLQHPSGRVGLRPLPPGCQALPPPAGRPAQRGGREIVVAALTPTPDAAACRRAEADPASAPSTPGGGDDVDDDAGADADLTPDAVPVGAGLAPSQLPAHADAVGAPAAGTAAPPPVGEAPAPSSRGSKRPAGDPPADVDGVAKRQALGGGDGGRPGELAACDETLEGGGAAALWGYDPTRLEWPEVTAFMRVSASVRKVPLLLFVHVDPDADAGSPAFLSGVRVEERRLSRWLPSVDRNIQGPSA